MRGNRSVRVRTLQLFWSRETFRQLQVGLATWVACGVGLSLAFEQQAPGVLPSWRTMALAAGFGLGAFALVAYGGLRFLLAPRRLSALAGAGILFLLPVALGLLVPLLLGQRDITLFGSRIAPVLEAGLLLLLTTCLLFAYGHRPHHEEPRPRDLAPLLVLLALAIGLVVWRLPPPTEVPEVENITISVLNAAP